MPDRVSDKTWKQIVEYSPLVSVDLVVEYDGGVVLGQRENELARGEWFVPGGIVRKGESLEKAVHRIAEKELDSTVSIEAQLGIYEHHYDSSEFEDVSKHYVPTGYVVTLTQGFGEPDSQHSDLGVFYPPFQGFHEYVQQYLDDYVAWKW